MKQHLVVAGSLNQDIVLSVRRFPGAGETVHGSDLRTFCGGKGANQAYAAAKLGAPVIMLGQLGTDASGDEQLRNLRSAGVNTEYVRRDAETPTGTAVIAVDEMRQNRIIVIPGANAHFNPAALEMKVLSAASFLLLQLEIPVETVAAAAEAAKRGGAVVLLDPAPVVPLESTLLRRVDYLTPNLSELAAMSGLALAEDAPADAIVRAARVLCERGVRKVIAKLGERGAMLVTAESVLHWPAFPVRAVDTTAAGDCFNAAFASALLRGDAEPEAGRFASAAAAIAVTRHGAQPGMPSLDEVEEFMERHGCGRPAAGLGSALR